MVRPCASKENRLLCLQFAQACTKSTQNPTDLLARCGPLSPFAALSRCSPSSVRIDGQGRRDGITELECNKVLQTGGFEMIRDRRATAKNKVEDPYGSGLYLYTEVQWRDPENSEDLCHLLHSWNMLRANHENFAKECSFETFLGVIRQMLHAWKPKNSRKDVRVRSNKRKSPTDQDSSISTCSTPMERQDSQMSLASTVVEDGSRDSPSTIPRSRSCSWTREVDDECQAPAKRQCFEFPLHQDLTPVAVELPTVQHLPMQANPIQHAQFQKMMGQGQVWWEPETKAELHQTKAELHVPDFWDMAVGPRLVEEEKVDDAVVLSLLQRPTPAVPVF